MQREPSTFLSMAVATAFVALAIALAAMGELGFPLSIVLVGWVTWTLALGRPMAAVLPCALALGLATSLHFEAARPVIGLLGEQQSFRERAAYALSWGAFFGGALGFAVSTGVGATVTHVRGRALLGTVTIMLLAAGGVTWSDIPEARTPETVLRAIPPVGVLRRDDRSLIIEGRAILRDETGRIAVVEAEEADEWRYLPAACERLADAEGGLEVRRVRQLLVVTPEGALDDVDGPMPSYDRWPLVDGCAFDLRGRASLLAGALTAAPPHTGLGELATLSAELACACLLLAWMFARGLTRALRGCDAESDGHGVVQTENGQKARLLAPAGPVVVLLERGGDAYREQGMATAELLRRGQKETLVSWYRERLAAALGLAVGLAALCVLPALILALDAPEADRPGSTSPAAGTSLAPP